MMTERERVLRVQVAATMDIIAPRLNVAARRTSELVCLLTVPAALAAAIEEFCDATSITNGRLALAVAASFLVADEIDRRIRGNT